MVPVAAGDFRHVQDRLAGRGGVLGGLLLLFRELRGQLHRLGQDVGVCVLIRLLHRGLRDLAALAADLHFRIVNALFGDVLVAVANAEGALGVVVRVLLAVLAARVPLTLLRLPQRLVIGVVPRPLLQLLVNPDLMHLVVRKVTAASMVQSSTFTGRDRVALGVDSVPAVFGDQHAD